LVIIFVDAGASAEQKTRLAALAEALMTDNTYQDSGRAAKLHARSGGMPAPDVRSKKRQSFPSFIRQFRCME
jgi:hypothetical protein